MRASSSSLVISNISFSMSSALSFARSARVGALKADLSGYRERQMPALGAAGHDLLLIGNPGRAKKRRGEPLSKVDLRRPFDGAKFHFGKIDPRELLHQFVVDRRDARASRAGSLVPSTWWLTAPFRHPAIISTLNGRHRDAYLRQAPRGVSPCARLPP